MTPTLAPPLTRTPLPRPRPSQSWVATGSLEFTPGERTQYSSTNFVLLGLLLAQLTGARAWDAYEQRALLEPLPAARRALYRNLTFGVHGAPAERTQLHGYDRTSYNGGDPAARPGRDVWRVAGVYAGWTASDVRRIRAAAPAARRSRAWVGASS